MEPDAGDGTQDVQWMKFYPGSQKKHTQRTSGSDDVTKTELKTQIKTELMRG